MATIHRMRGFTLLEILGSLLVLGILVTICMPVIGKFRERAQGVQCAANLKALGAGAAAYLSDHGDVWPQIPPELQAGAAGGVSSTAVRWIAALEPYGIPEKTWRCPSLESKMAAKGNPAALNRRRIDYVPTTFGALPGSARQWPTHPWFLERSALHGTGPNIFLANGSVVSMNELLSNPR